MTKKLVYNIEPATPSMIRSLDRHCLSRVPDGASAIDPERSHLNRILVGEKEGVQASLDALYASGVKRPAKQAEAPYLRIVVSASPEYFRPDDPAAAGTWDDEALAAWLKATMDQLKTEYGDDLVYAELHLDEDTPHIHAVVAPTYMKKPRIPGRKKKNETADEFKARKAAVAASEGIRTVGRSSHATLSQKGSFQRLRERMAVAVDHLGIEYGDDRSVDAPDGQSTREWVKSQAAQLRIEAQELRRERIQSRWDMRRKDRAWSKDLGNREEALTRRAAKIESEKNDFEAAASERVQQLNAARAKIIKDREVIAQDKVEVLRVRKELLRDRAKLNERSNELDRRETYLDALRSRVIGLARSVAERLGLDVSGKMSDAIRQIEDEIEDRAMEAARASDPFLATVPNPEDPVEESGPGF